jgi:choline dehydrogenase
LAQESEYDYVIVGTGAGGGTLAARLAEAGMRVCLLEAGGDALANHAGGRLPEDRCRVFIPLHRKTRR